MDTTWLYAALLSTPPIVCQTLADHPGLSLTFLGNTTVMGRWIYQSWSLISALSTHGEER